MQTAAVLTGILTSSGDGTLELSEVGFLEPAHLVGAAALAHAARQQGREFLLVPPSLPGTARFACRMRLGRVLADLGFDDPLGRVTERPLHTELLEVTALGPDGTAAADLAQLVSEKVRSGHGDAVAHALHQSVSEIGQNAETYAGITGYVAAVTLPRSRELLIAVADAGVGLASTLGRGEPMTDREALGLALQGVSSRHGPGRGSGIRLTLETVRAVGGRGLLLSGSAAVGVSLARPAASTDLVHGFPGTLFQASIPVGDGVG